jgi:dATP pyrophosphohydrolase
MVPADCVSVFVVAPNQKGKEHLLIRRSGAYLTGTWQMVSGGIEPGEQAWEAALRELKKETGIIPDILYSADAVETFYLKLKDKVTFVPVFVAMINSPQEVTLLPKEHDAFEWVPFETALDKLVFSEQKRIIRNVHEDYVLQKPHPFHLIWRKPFEPAA